MTVWGQQGSAVRRSKGNRPVQFYQVLSCSLCSGPRPRLTPHTPPRSLPASPCPALAAWARPSRQPLARAGAARCAAALTPAPPQDKVLRMLYVWALCRDQDELNPYAAWRLLDISASSTEQTL